MLGSESLTSYDTLAYTNAIYCFSYQGMAVLASERDQQLSDESSIRFRAVKFPFHNGVVSSRPLVVRQLFPKERKVPRNDVKSSSSVPDIYIIVVVSSNALSFCFIVKF